MRDRLLRCSSVFELVCRAPEGERLCLREEVRRQQVVPLRRISRRAGETDQVDGHQHGPLMEELEDRVLRVRSRTAPQDRSRVDCDRLAGGRDRLPVRLHPELLEVGRKQPESMAVRHDRDGLRAHEVPVPEGQEPADDREVPAERGGGEVLVHGVEATEERAEVLVAERDQQGKPDRRAERRPAANPVPHAKHVLRRNPYALAGFESYRHPYDMTCEVGARSEGRDQPFARRICVLDRLERRHRLRDDDEERLGRIEILRRHRKIVRVHVRDETHGELGRRIRLERCIRHRRAEIASADTDVHDGSNTPACRPQPLSRPHLLCERRHAIELVVDLR